MTSGQPRLAGVGGPSVLLFSAPWMKATWPSLAVGSLKAFLQASGVQTRCCHLHLEAAVALGWTHYDALAETWGAGEALFGALLDPADSDRLVAVAAGLLRGANRPATARWAEETARDDLRAFVDAWLERERPEDYPLVGGSVGAMQLCGTLYLMKRVRERGHAGQRVLGGSGLVGTVAREVLMRCPDVDAVVDGEGEQALLGLAQRVTRGSRESVGLLPGVLTRDGAGEVVAGGVVASVNLAAAPAADLDEFYEAAGKLGVPRTALTIPFEHSRGCEWEHRTKGKLRGCTFCGLYRGSPDHRRKPTDLVLREMERAVQRFRVLNLAFVDAYLPAGYRDELLDGLIGMRADISFFTEMRCDLTTPTVERLAARANRVQLGVESFSSAILRRIGKGVGAAKTVHAVRLCQEYGVPTQYNVMLRIPGVPRDEIDELCLVLPTLFGLPPPNAADFYLDRNSLIFADPEAHGVAPDRLDSTRPSWLPRSLGDSRISQAVPFESADEEVEAAWSRVERQIERWRERWRLATSNRMESPLTWRDGGGWASVIDAREDVARIYLLEGILYEVFLACNEVVSQQHLVELLRHHSPAMLAGALRELASHRLVLQDGALWVSVAVRAGREWTRGGGSLRRVEEASLPATTSE
jgi:ribosomal peptide maturation radical SAM protein 1